MGAVDRGLRGAWDVEGGAGAWRVARGAWRVARGAWRVARGAWRAARGAWREQKRFAPQWKDE